MLKDKLKQLRADRGVSQRVVAEALEAAQQTVASWEIGRTEPNSVMLKRLANYFNVSTDYLLDNDSHDAGIMMYRRLNDANRQTIDDMMSILCARQRQPAPA